MRSTSTSTPRLPRAVREISAAVTGGVTAAHAGDEPALAEAAAKLAAADAEQVRLLFGAVLRQVLEERHPDGVTGDDLRDLLEHLVRTALWFPELDVQVMIVVLTGALGVHEPEPDDPDDWNNRTPPPAVEAVVRHASLLVDDLLREPAQSPEAFAAEVRARVDGVLLEMSQTQPQEMP